MKNITSKLNSINWKAVTDQLNEKGYTIVPGLLSTGQCKELIQDFDNADLYRKKVVMERYRFGLGEYKYFDYPLPGLIQKIREKVYPQLMPLANLWMNVLKTGRQFPGDFADFQKLCHDNGQMKPTALILKYSSGGHNTLHQDLYGDIFFPIQLVLFLNNPGEDYTGGEFVLMQQTPRAQSKAIVLQPRMGDMLLFATNFRPVKGIRGYYKASMKHGVSEVLKGKRHTLGIIFHDALT